MRQIGDVIISDEVWQKKFACDLQKCLGKCCQYGDLGAPLSEEEEETIVRLLPHLEKYLEKNNMRFLKAGISETYQGSLHIREIAANTPCPLAYTDSQKKVLCSLHTFALDEKVPLLQAKPLWCSLFPLIIKKTAEGWLINCHIPDFCRSVDDPPPLILSFSSLLQEFFGPEWVEAVRHEYEKDRKEQSKR
jgi:hypothetical protein